MACARGLCARECETAVNDCSVEDKSGTRIPANRVVPFHQGGTVSIVPRQHCPASATTRSAHVHQHVQIADRSLVRITSRSEDARRELNASSELPHFESAPFCGAWLATLRICVIVQQRSEYNYYSGKAQSSGRDKDGSPDECQGLLSVWLYRHKRRRCGVPQVIRNVLASTPCTRTNGRDTRPNSPAPT
jgi:hypothetical protein